MTESPYRPGLPPVPWRLRARPIHRGYPVPWFVAEVDGVPDFRIVDSRKYTPALERRLSSFLCFGRWPPGTPCRRRSTTRAAPRRSSG
jgi:hypothetical protein